MRKPQARRLLRRLLGHVGADGALLLGATGILALVIARGGGRLVLAAPSLVAPVETFAPVVLLCAFFRRQDGARRALARAVRDWLPFFSLYVLYENLERATGFLATRAVERQLLAIDRRIFGVEPSAFVQRFASGWLSDALAFSYSLMFVMPFAIMALLYARDRRRDFREVGLAMLLVSYGGFLLYIALPARSPRVAFPELYGAPLHGAIGIYELVTRAWDRVELMLYDAFPSLHTAVSTLSLGYAVRMGRRIFPRRPRALAALYAPFVVSLQLSTLYLRQHYFVDLVGGWALAAACLLLAPRLAKGYARLLDRLEPRAAPVPVPAPVATGAGR